MSGEDPMPRGNKAWAPLMRKRIEASQVANRLMDHVDNDGDLLTTSQVTAAIALLRKVMPDLKATEITGADGKDLFNNIERTVVNANAKD